MINTILFDLDGTLVQHSHVLLPRKLAEWGCPRPARSVETAFSCQIQWFYEFAATLDDTQKTDESLWPRIWRDIYQRVATDLCIDNPAIVDRMEQFFASEPTPPLYPDVRPLLRALEEQTWHLGIITQRGRQAAQRYLREHRIHDRFTVLIAGDDGYGRKPSPHPFQAALTHLDSHAEQAVYIGDRVDDDCGGAAAAGLYRAFLIDRSGLQGDRFEHIEEVHYTPLRSLLDLLNHIQHGRHTQERENGQS